MHWKIFFILFFSISCYNEDGIIKLPLSQKDEFHYSKYGFSYQLGESFNNDVGFLPTTYYYIYKFKNIKNLNLFDEKKYQIIQYLLNMKYMEKKRMKFIYHSAISEMSLVWN